MKEAQDRGDPVASRITNLRLDTNHFTMLLSDPYAYLDEDDEEDDEESVEKVRLGLTNCIHQKVHYRYVLHVLTICPVR